MDLINKREYTVCMRECDMFGRIRPSVVMGLFQDGSGAVLNNLGAGIQTMGDKGLIWVVARIACEILRAPRCEERIKVLVWLEPARLGMYPWQYRIEDERGDSLVRATAVWVISDAEKRTMLSSRVPRLVYDAAEPPEPPMQRPMPLKIPALTEHTTRHVAYSETDMNGHMTNTRYLDWVCDLLEPDYHRNHPVRFLRVDYRMESLPGEEVALDWRKEENTLWCCGNGKFNAMFQF